MPFDRSQYLARTARMERPGESEELALPSGVVARVRRLEAEEWLARCVFPQALTMAAFRKFAAGQIDESKITDDHIVALAQSRQDIIVATLVEPRVVPDEVTVGSGELHYRELGAEDAQAVFDWATRRQEAAQLEPFRREPGVSSAGSDGGEVRTAPKRSGGRRRSAAGA